jgi:hypothetical protein
LYKSGPSSREQQETQQEQPHNQRGLNTQHSEIEPPPPYSPPTPLPMSVDSNSIITQVAPSFQPQLSSQIVHDPSGNILLDLRGTLFDIPKEELLRLPESILLGISNGLLFDNEGSLIVNLSEARTATVNFSPECLKYTLDTFRNVAKDLDPPYLSIDSQGLLEESLEETAPGPSVSHDPVINISEVFKRRPAIIVLREDLDYYCLPAEPGQISVEKMQELKRTCGKIVVEQNKVFSGLRKADDTGSPEHHLIEMLCSSGFHIDDSWGFRSREPNKTVISSLALIPLKQSLDEPDVSGQDGESDLPTPHKLLLFWRKPARKCWWDSMTLNDVEGCEGPLRVHIRRVWTLELSVLGVREI